MHRAHAYLKPPVLRTAWAQVLRAVQQDTRSVIHVPKNPTGWAKTGAKTGANTADQEQGVLSRGEQQEDDKVAVATSDVASQHGVLQPGDVRVVLCCPLRVPMCSLLLWCWL